MRSKYFIALAISYPQDISLAAGEFHWKKHFRRSAFFMAILAGLEPKNHIENFDVKWNYHSHFLSFSTQFVLVMLCVKQFDYVWLIIFQYFCSHLSGVQCFKIKYYRSLKKNRLSCCTPLCASESLFLGSKYYSIRHPFSFIQFLCQLFGYLKPAFKYYYREWLSS